MPERMRALTCRLAHLLPTLWLAAGVIAVALDLAPPGLVETVLLWVIGSFAVAAVVAEGSFHFHQRLMCTICMAMTPLDTAAAIARCRRRLRAHHQAAAPLVLLVGMAVLFTVRFGFGMPKLAFTLSMDALLLVAAVMVHIELLHGILRPWCPYCRRPWGDGGEPEHVPDPLPDPRESVVR